MIGFLKAFLSVAAAFFGWLDRKRLMDAGKAEAGNEAILEARKRVDDALDNPVSDELRKSRYRD